MAYYFCHGRHCSILSQLYVTFGAEWPEPIPSEKVFIKFDDSGSNQVFRRTYIDFIWDTHKRLANGKDNDRHLHQSRGFHLAGEEAVCQCDWETDSVVRDVDPSKQGFSNGHLFNFDAILPRCSMVTISGESTVFNTDDPLDGQNLEMFRIERV
ncbi:hypothetical protein BDV40DRAFT_302624 [Aspergillus tamarii]|uniref:Uncharacterized protein n=1 Tax=Aspergillus tamarii TaxID=41984 RepID=A0A5N6UN74_ASPTM|nr:hypothetical protein BDV40DRAFT_302624 [Aspergillus tamarii]